MEGSPLKVRLFTIAFGAALLALVPAMASAAERSTLDLSSWTPTTQGMDIVGGTRTVTVTNYLAEPVDGIVFDLGEAPCTCSVASASASHGSASGSDWSIGRLDAGERAELTITYATVEAAGGPLGTQRPPGAATLTLVAILGSLGILILGRNRSGVARAA